MVTGVDVSEGLVLRDSDLLRRIDQGRLSSHRRVSGDLNPKEPWITHERKEGSGKKRGRGWAGRAQRVFRAGELLCGAVAGDAHPHTSPRTHRTNTTKSGPQCTAEQHSMGDG